MPADTSHNSNSESRRQRAREMMSRQSTASSSDGAAATDQSRTSSQADQSSQARNRAPKRSDGDRIDKVLGALAGKPPQAQSPEKGPEADLKDAGRDDDRDEQKAPPSSSQRDQQRPAFEIDDDEPDEPAEKPRKKVRAKTLGEFAEELEVDPKHIYNLSVTVRDGEAPITIGQLKDHYKASGDLDRNATEFEDYRVQVQNEIIKGRNEIDAVLRQVAAVVPRKDVERILLTVRDQAAEMKASCQKELREYFPEWDDDDVRRSAGKRMAGWLVSYGIPAEVLGNLYDAKIIRMLYQMGLRAERYMSLKAGERVKQPSVEPKSSRRKPSPTPNETARERVMKGDKVGAVTALLMGKSNGHDKSR